MDDIGSMEKVLVRRDGAVTWLVFNQPEKRNAMSLDMTVMALKADAF